MKILYKAFRKPLIGWFKFKFIKTKLQDLTILNALEAYLTERVLGGEESRREELASMQLQIEENKRFIKFLEKL